MQCVILIGEEAKDQRQRNLLKDKAKTEIK